MEIAKDDNIVIVGAGLCGLSAALALTDAGLKPIVVEKSDKVGGLARSIELDGQFFDIGVHTFRNCSDPIINYILDKAVKERLYGDLDYGLNIGTRKISPNPELANFIKYPTRLKLDLIRKTGSRTGRFDTMENRLLSSYGEWLYNHFFEAFISKKLPGFSGRKVHGDWWGMGNLRDELNRYTEGNLIAHSAAHKRIWSRLIKAGHFIFGRENPLIYTYRGIGGISESLGKSVADSGAKIFFETGIQRLIFDNRRLSGAILSDGTMVETSTLIWSGMLPDLVALLDLQWPYERLPYISTALVLLVYSGGKSLKRKYLFEYSADRDIIFQRFYFNDFYNRKKDEFGICCEIAYDDQDGLPNDSEILERASAGLRKLGAIQQEEIVNALVIREKRSHPVYPIDYRESLTDLFGRINEFSGIFPAGRSGAFNNIGMATAILIGWKIGRHCLSRLQGGEGDGEE